MTKMILDTTNLSTKKFEQIKLILEVDEINFSNTYEACLTYFAENNLIIDESTGSSVIDPVKKNYTRKCLDTEGKIYNFTFSKKEPS